MMVVNHITLHMLNHAVIVNDGHIYSLIDPYQLVGSTTALDASYHENHGGTTQGQLLPVKHGGTHGCLLLVGWLVALAVRMYIMDKWFSN